MKADIPIPRRYDSLQDFVALLDRRARLKRIHLALAGPGGRAVGLLARLRATSRPAGPPGRGGGQARRMPVESCV